MEETADSHDSDSSQLQSDLEDDSSELPEKRTGSYFDLNL